MQEAIAAFNRAVDSFTGSTSALTTTAETLLSEQQDARDREVTRERRDKRRFRVFGIALVVLSAVTAWNLVLRYQDEQTRTERAVLSEQQRRCSDTLMADALVRVSIYATARGATDPVVVARLRTEVEASRSDPSQLPKVRDDLDRLLHALPVDAGGALREDAEKANGRLLRVRAICYQGTPPEDPLAA
jgi:hypothetical protein